MKTFWSPVTESNRRPSPYHAGRFRLGASYRVGLPQVAAIPVSEHVALCLSLPGAVVTWIVTGQAGSRIHPVGAGDPSGHSALGRGARPPPGRARPRAETVGRQLAPKNPVVIHVAPSRPAQEPLPTQHSTAPWENNGMSHLGPGSGAVCRARPEDDMPSQFCMSHLAPGSVAVVGAAWPSQTSNPSSACRISGPAQERAPQPGHEDLPAAARLPDITPVPDQDTSGPAHDGQAGRGT